jgi:hypothetical protein
VETAALGPEEVELDETVAWLPVRPLDDLTPPAPLEFDIEKFLEKVFVLEAGAEDRLWDGLEAEGEPDIGL